MVLFIAFFSHISSDAALVIMPPLGALMFLAVGRHPVAGLLAAIAGVGAVQLPILMAKEQLAAGELVALLEGWEPRREVIHAVFPSRRGLLPSVRALVDFLTDEYARMAEE